MVKHSFLNVGQSMFSLTSSPKCVLAAGPPSLVLFRPLAWLSVKEGLTRAFIRRGRIKRGQRKRENFMKDRFEPLGSLTMAQRENVCLVHFGSGSP